MKRPRPQDGSLTLGGPADQDEAAQLGGGAPFLPPVTEDGRLDLVETGTFGSRVIYERYRRAR